MAMKFQCRSFKSRMILKGVTIT